MKLKDESGITLVELLAALSILSVVILLAGSIHMFGQRHFINQTESASQANNLSYALTVMSTDLRKTDVNNVHVNEEDNIIEITDRAEYYVTSKKLYENGTVLADYVDSMTVKEIENGVTIILQTSNKNARNKNYETTVYFRGVSNE